MAVAGKHRHLLGIAMIGDDQGAASCLAQGCDYAADSGVHSLHCCNCRLHLTAMADHVGIGEIDQAKAIFARFNQRHRPGGNLRRLHLRRIGKCDAPVGRDEDVIFHGSIQRLTIAAVEEEGDMGVFLRFSQAKLFDAKPQNALAKWILNPGRPQYLQGGKVAILIINHHARIGDVRALAAIKGVKIIQFKGLGDFNGAVAPEIYHHHRIAIINHAHGPVCIIDNHKAGHVLINQPGLPCAEKINRIRHAGKAMLAFAMHHQFPAFSHFIPVAIAIHHDALATAAAGEAVIEPVLFIDMAEIRFQLADIFLRRLNADIASVEQRMHAQTPHALRKGVTNQRPEMGQMGMDIAIGEQSDEMQRSIRPGDLHHLFYGLGLKKRAIGNGAINTRRPLIKNPASPHGQMTDFRAAHILV